MPRVCSICVHPKRKEIDRALTERSASNRRIAAQYGVNESAIRGHKTNHLRVRMLKAVEKREDADIRTAIDVVAQLRAINGAALTVLKDARDANDGDLALKAIDRIQRQIELQAKLIGELQQEGTTNIIVNPEWVQLRSALMVALTPFPEAAQAVAGTLVSLEGGRSHAAD
jgi:hypothetical protein